MSRSDKKGVVALLRMRSVLAVNLAAALFIAWGFAGEYMRSRGMQDEIDRLQEQAASLETKNLELADMANRYSSSSMLEREARLKLNMQRPGEEVVVVREGAMFEGGGDPSTRLGAGKGRRGEGEEGAEESSAISNAKKWFNHFFPMNKSQ